MKIISKSDNISERQLFQLTEGGTSSKLKDSVGRQFDAVGYVHYTDSDRKNGEEREMLIIITADGDSLATNSSTVIRTFKKMLDCVPLPISDIEITSDINQKTGREFLNLMLI